MRRVLAVILCCVGVGRLGATMREAMVAAALLADLCEARVVRVELAASVPSEKNPEFFGVAFTFEQCSWVYLPEQGTRVLGPATPAAFDPEHLTATLKLARVPAQRVTVYAPRSYPVALPGQSSLPNACVVGAMVGLERLIVEGVPLDQPGLVLLSYDSSNAAHAATLLVDHCVLVFRQYGRWQCIDPRTPDRLVSMENVAVGAPLDPALLEIALRKTYPLKSARLLLVQPSTVDQISHNALWRQNRTATEAAP